MTGENAGSELRMVLLGSTRTGKSASGKTILGSRQFISKASSSTVTKECVKIKGEADGRCLAVVDTPGLCDTELTNEASLRDIGKCISLSSPGPHAFLIVIQLGRFTEEERETVELIQKAFGEEAERYTMVLFTHGDDLEHEKFEDYYKRADEHLKQFVEKCGGRCHFFNNKNMQDRTQVKGLLEKIDKMVIENGGGCYTNEMYKEVEAALEEEKKKIMKDNPGFSEEDAQEYSPLIMAAEIQENELRMVLLGSTGTGKSASGNTILGSRQFISKASSSTVTKECVKIKGDADGRCVAVVDTPGLCDTELANEESLRDTGKCISLSSPGPHAFLIVIQLGRFTEEERETVKRLQKAFGKEAERYTMVLFTHGDDLEDETFENYYQRADEKLKQLVKKCGNRYHVFNNRNMDDRTQVTELLKKIEKMVKENGGGCYTSEMYEKAEAAIEEEKVKIMKDNPGCSDLLARSDAEESNLVTGHSSGAQRGVLTGAAVGTVAGVAVGAVAGAAIGAVAGAVAGAAVGAVVGAAVGAVMGAAVGAVAGAAVGGPIGAAVGAAAGIFATRNQ